MPNPTKRQPSSRLSSLSLTTLLQPHRNTDAARSSDNFTTFIFPNSGPPSIKETIASFTETMTFSRLLVLLSAALYGEIERVFALK